MCLEHVVEGKVTLGVVSGQAGEDPKPLLGERGHRQHERSRVAWKQNVCRSHSLYTALGCVLTSLSGFGRGHQVRVESWSRIADGVQDRMLSSQRCSNQGAWRGPRATTLRPWHNMVRSSELPSVTPASTALRTATVPLLWSTSATVTPGPLSSERHLSLPRSRDERFDNQVPSFQLHFLVCQWPSKMKCNTTFVLSTNLGIGVASGAVWSAQCVTQLCAVGAHRGLPRTTLKNEVSEIDTFLQELET